MCCSQRRSESACREPGQNRKRYSLAGVGTSLWPGRTQIARDSARLVHHARQGEPGDVRNDDSGLRTSDRK